MFGAGCSYTILCDTCFLPHIRFLFLLRINDDPCSNLILFGLFFISFLLFLQEFLGFVNFKMDDLNDSAKNIGGSYVVYYYVFI